MAGFFGFGAFADGVGEEEIVLAGFGVLLLLPEGLGEEQAEAGGFGVEAGGDAQGGAASPEALTMDIDS